MVSAECEPVMGLWDRAPSGVPTEGRAPGQGALRLLFWGNKGAFTKVVWAYGKGITMSSRTQTKMVLFWWK